MCLDVKLPVLNSEKGPSTWLGFCSPPRLQLIRPSADSVPTDPKRVQHKRFLPRGIGSRRVLLALDRKGSQVAQGHACVCDWGTQRKIMF